MFRVVKSFGPSKCLHGVLRSAVATGQLSVIPHREKYDLSKHVSPWPQYYHPSPKREVPALQKDYKEAPERDLVNFPHYEEKLWPSKVRMYVFPEPWFQFLEKKTGALGPYFLVIGTATFLIQKEIFVIDAESELVISAYMFIYAVARLAGPWFAQFSGDKLDDYFGLMYAEKDNELIAADEGIKAEHFLQQCKQTMLANLFEAKIENVALQLEAAYRARLRAAHTQVKKQLDYICEVEEIKRRLQHKHMVSWIVEQVRKSITPELERATLQQCVLDLKTLAGRV